WICTPATMPMAPNARLPLQRRRPRCRFRNTAIPRTAAGSLPSRLRPCSTGSAPWWWPSMQAMAARIRARTAPAALSRRASRWLTRDGDYFIPLAQRYRIARENNADLFVSIHADSFTSDDARGSSVWVLSPRGKTSMAARWLADGQNRADLIGGISLDDKDDGLAKVLLDLQQGWAIQASDEVAG